MRRRIPWFNSYAAVFWLLMGGLLTVPCAAQPMMESAPKGVGEAGTPTFVVQGPDAIGLSTPVVDLQQLPDGRMLIVAQRELALGDGVRWKVHRARDGEQPILGPVALGPHGEIYTPAEKGFAEIVFGNDGQWSRHVLAAFPATSETEGVRITSVTTLRNDWYWYGSGGTILSWKPGGVAQVAGEVASVERIFELGAEVFASSQSSGALFRLERDGRTTRVSDSNAVSSDAVTAATPFTAGSLLIGTNGSGLKLFNHDGIHPLALSESLQGQRINDIVPMGERYFAAAADGMGIVFIDRDGQVSQALDHSLDHRMGHVRRLRYTAEGVLWALLSESIARIEFPSRISNFEPLLPGGLPFAQPVRHNGQLWIVTDARALRGVYDGSGLLLRFEPDTPPGRALFQLISIDGHLLATNELGIHEWKPDGWRLLVSGVVNARLGISEPKEGRSLYVARGEIGWMQFTADGLKLSPTVARGLENTYDTTESSPGIVWLELGPGRLGRLDATKPELQLKIFTHEDGLTEGWSQVFQLGRVTRFNDNNRILLFDEASGKFVEDQSFQTNYPELGAAPRRPTKDALGRLWFSARGTAVFLSNEGGHRSVQVVDAGFEPYKYTMEKNGVVWMWGNHRLARYDPRLPPRVTASPKAIITGVQLPESNRLIYTPTGTLGTLAYADNSPVFHFVAPGISFDASTFEVLLEGAGTRWLKIGSVGLFALNRVKEGKYVFHVRPVSGGQIGTEAMIAFSIRAPWYRTTIAWIAYAITGVVLVVGIAWFWSFLERREKERLGHLVEERTAELQTQVRETVEKASALAASEERFRVLNSVLEARVVERTAEVAYERDLLRALLESSPDKIYFKDLESRFIKCSVALAKSFNVNSVDDVIGKKDSDFLTESYAGPAFEDEKNIVQTGRAIIAKTEKEVWLDGRVSWVMTSKIPLWDSAGKIAGTIGISRDITELKEAEAKLEEVNKQLLHTSHQAGMAEVATSVLHNVGNVLNSVNVSTTLVSEQLRGSKVLFVRKIADMFESNAKDLAGFLTKDPKGMKIVPYLSTLSNSLLAEQAKMAEELEHLRKQVEHIKEIIAMQQNFAKVSGVAEAVLATELVEDAIRINSSSLTWHEVKIIRDFRAKPTLNIERHKVMQVLVNLIRNAKQACDETSSDSKTVVVRITEAARRVSFSIVDNGVGIPGENLARIFAHGFSTKKDGHGFGLHSAALSAKELRGTLIASSAGLGLGATFVLNLPIDPAQA